MSDRRSTTLVTEEFNGSAIVFRGDAWVNATQMAKPFGKRPLHFLQLPSTKEFMAALAKDLGVMTENPSSLFETVRGHHADGRQQGTWMHPDLALEFARWLSPEFAIWTNRVIRRLLSGQPVATPIVDLSETNGLLRLLLAQALETNDRLRVMQHATERIAQRQEMGLRATASILRRQLLNDLTQEIAAPAPAQPPPPVAATRPPSHHAKWTPEEDARLIAAVKAGRSIGELAKEHGRSTWAITSRIVKHGLLATT